VKKKNVKSTVLRVPEEGRVPPLGVTVSCRGVVPGGERGVQGKQEPEGPVKVDRITRRGETSGP